MGCAQDWMCAYCDVPVSGVGVRFIIPCATHLSVGGSMNLARTRPFVRRIDQARTRWNRVPIYERRSNLVRHILHRILFYACAAWAAITLDFFIPRLAPGDPVA